jgi:uncharacterized protein
MNRLAAASSPYLRQHAQNPVAWWPWGAEAFAEAKRLNKPVFISIGYAACHWCHVMAHESFEDNDTAALMNETFVNIKVDREEWPDVDAIYMNAIMVQGEGGGWPLSAFCFPDGKPFYMGTYFPKAARFGKPSFADVIGMLRDTYRDERDKLVENADALAEGLVQVDAHYLGKATAISAATNRGAWVSQLSASLLIAAGREIAERCDHTFGGLKGKPKFPSSSTHELLTRIGRLAFGDKAKAAASKWALAMANGGIYDHLGGGFARYSVDERWLVPHFEKMLYDQGQLLSVMADALAVNGDVRFADVIAETTAFLRREMRATHGGLWSSIDADSDGVEGKFYVWTLAELKSALGALASLHVAKAYGVSEAGNFEHGSSVLARVTPRGTSYEESDLQQQRIKLLATRQLRTGPGCDDKVLSGWNGLAISGLVAAWKASGYDDALQLAVEAGSFVCQHMIANDSNGLSLARILAQDPRTPRLDGTLDDYAFVAAAMLDLAEATGTSTWFNVARALLAAARRRFVSEIDGKLVMYLAADDDLLIHRPQSHTDGAIPSGAAVAIECWLRVAQLALDEDALSLAERYLAERVVGSGAVNPLSHPRLLSALDRYLHGAVVVVSPGAGRDSLLTAARRCYAPTTAIAGDFAAASLLADKSPTASGAAAAYVCRGQACSLPVSDPTALRQLLQQAP